MNDDAQTIPVTEINPIDYYNQNYIQEAFELMLKVKGVKAVSIDALTVYVNKGDNEKRMIVLENGNFIIKMKNALNLQVDKVYSPFMLLQKFKFKDSFIHAKAYVEVELMHNDYPFVRIGTKYFKTISKIDRYGINRTELVYWEKLTIADDYPKSIFEVIQKFDDFTINPDNKSHSPVINNNYNLYSPFEH